MWWAGGKRGHSHAFGPVGEKTNSTDAAAATAASAAVLSQWTLCNHSQHRYVVFFVFPFCICPSNHNVKHFTCVCILVCKSVCMCVFSALLEGEFEEMESRLVYLETLCSHCDEQAFKQQNISSLETHRKKKRYDLLFSGHPVNAFCSNVHYSSKRANQIKTGQSVQSPKIMQNECIWRNELKICSSFICYRKELDALDGKQYFFSPNTFLIHSCMIVS